MIKNFLNRKMYFVLSLLCIQQAFSQGTYLEKGNSGAFAVVSYAGNSDVESLLGSLGYSFSGVFDIHFGLGKTSLYHTSDGSIERTISDVGFEVLLIKQDPVKTPTSPFSLGFSVDYSSLSTKSTTRGEFTFNGSISRVNMLSNNYGFELALFIGHTVPDKNNTTVYGGSISLIAHATRSIIIAAGPSFASGDNVTTVGVSAGVICITGVL